MLIYNSLSGKKELLKKSKKIINLFVCGPTVYEDAHIGHARTYIAFDVIVKFLRFQKYKIFYLQNITNVDDRIINKAKELKINPFLLAFKFEKKFLKNMREIGVDSVNKYARASEYIPQIISQIKTLIKKGFAYEILNEGWYFQISQFKEYGKLSHRTIAQAEDSLSRIDENTKKRNKGDFCLWKYVLPPKKSPSLYKYKLIEGEPGWQTPLGFGRPGWHIEDTAITESFFGTQYDMHGGGVDIKFPHHEAEIAQQEAASGKRPFVQYWLHVGSLLINEKKMSKSLNNFITINDFLGSNKIFRERNATILRILMITKHYRLPINFNSEIKDQAEKIFSTIESFFNSLNFVEKKSVQKKSSLFIPDLLIKIKNEFIKEMENDFNTSGALAALLSGFQKIQLSLFSISPKDAISVENQFRELFNILGINIPKIKIPLKIVKISEKRELYRRNKQFMQADTLRNKLSELGYELKDTPLGPFIQKNN